MNHRTVDLTALTLAYTDFGGTGSAALLLHGLAGYADEWRSTANWLTGIHHVFALDQRGHGLSDKPPTGYSRDEYVEDIVGVIEGLQLRPVVLIGQSMGGLNAFLVAARRPDLVRALIVAEATPAIDRFAQRQIAKLLRAWPVPFRSRKDAETFFGGDTSCARSWAEGLEKRADGYWPRFRTENMVASLADVATRDYWIEWQRVQCPTLLVSGELSATPKHDLIEMTQRLTLCRHISIANAAHDVHLEQPEVWREIVQSFLQPL